MKIAAKLTAQDWADAKKMLVVGGDAVPWQSAFDQFFRQRLQLRYLDPIKVLMANDRQRGEGFTITAIQCTLIEFLAAANVGKNYRYKATRNPYEYSKSQELFVQFLSTRAPFSQHFDATSARAFYLSVRCGLLHEAKTKDGWRIGAKSFDGRAIDFGQKKVYRNDLQKLIQAFVEEFRERLAIDPQLQEAFVRKFDDLVT